MRSSKGVSRLPRLGLLGFVLGPSPATAQITYVDAVEGADGNTYATAGSLDNLDWLDSSGVTAGSDPVEWVKRTGFANGGTVFQAWHADSPGQIPELTTEVTGLADGTYDVWTFFWDASGTQVWSISAGLTSGDLTTYSFDGLGDTGTPVPASTLTFTNDPLFGEDDRVLHAVNLGQVSVTNGSPILVYTDNLVGAGFANRSWFDGIGYAPVLTEKELALQISPLSSTDGGIWEVAVTGERSTPYELLSSTTLDFESGTVLEGLTQGEPGDAGTIGGPNNTIVTTDEDGNASVRVALGEPPANFLRVQTPSIQAP